MLNLCIYRFDVLSMPLSGKWPGLVVYSGKGLPATVDMRLLGTLHLPLQRGTV